MTAVLTRLPILFAVLSMAALTGCGSADERGEAIGGGSTPTPTPAACVAGQERECRIIVAERAGYSDCVLGSQVCVAGAWSACTTSAASHIGDAGAETTESDAAAD